MSGEIRRPLPSHVYQDPSAVLHCAGAVEFRNEIQSRFGLDLPATVTFDYPSLSAMAGYIAERTLPTPSHRVLAALQLPGGGALAAGATTTELVGMSVVAASLGEGVGDASMAGQLFSSQDLIRPVPLQRWDVEQVVAADDILASNATRLAAWVSGVERFDEAIFRLSTAEAVGMDPQCRVLLEQTHAAIQVGKMLF